VTARKEATVHEWDIQTRQLRIITHDAIQLEIMNERHAFFFLLNFNFTWNILTIDKVSKVAKATQSPNLETKGNIGQWRGKKKLSEKEYMAT
jgi:hypothetical protein